MEISNDDGASWTLIERVIDTEGGPTEDWVERTVQITDYITPLTSQMKIRFSATDEPNNSISEAGIDAIHIHDILCGAVFCVTRGDLDGDGGVDGSDIGSFVECHLGGDPDTADCVCADIDGSGTFESADISLFVTCLLEDGCP